MKKYLVLILLMTMSCGPSNDMPPTIDLSGGVIPDRVPQWSEAFVPMDCPSEIPSGYNVQCGLLTVPENHDNPDGAVIELAVTRYFSREDAVLDDPVVYLEGGPGGSGTSTVAALIAEFRDYMDNRDLITFDQRGTGRSIPDLTCEDTQPVPGGDTDDLTLIGQCRQDLTDDGVDVEQYTSATNADDVNALRVALGYDKWNLLGISYGTRLALTVMRDHPEGVRSVILDSTVPVELNLYVPMGVNAQRSFEALFAQCAADPSCESRYPDLMGTLLALLDRLDATPATVQTSYGAEQVDGENLLEVLFNLMYSAEFLPYIPLFITQIDNGDYDVLASVFDALVQQNSGFAIGMHFSVNCAEEGAFLTEEDYLAASTDLYPRFRDHFSPGEFLSMCSLWNVPAAGTIETRPVVSDIPTLIMAGAFDPITPPSNGAMVHENLSKSQFFTFADGSHGVSVSDCGLEMATGFLDAPNNDAHVECFDAVALDPFYKRLGEKPVLMKFAIPGDSMPAPSFPFFNSPRIYFR